jgi:hypothetical protein
MSIIPINVSGVNSHVLKKDVIIKKLKGNGSYR